MSKKEIPQMEPWFDEAEAEAVAAYMKSGGWLMEFKKTKELEDEICRLTGSHYAVMTVNGTISLVLALLSLPLKPDDEVLVPAVTMIATPNSVKLIGFTPALVDIEPNTLCIDLKKAEEAITSKTKAMMYVPLNGRSGDMNRVVEFCRRHNLFLIEDSAQALGSYYQGKHLGTFGLIGSFSFSVPKIITTGQGGALITNDENLYKKIRKIKDFGRAQGGIDIHDEWGWNFKFTDIQAVIGLEQMKKLPWRINRKKEIFRQFYNGLSGIKEIKFINTNLDDTTPWFVDIFIKSPEKLALFLKEKSIGTRLHYPAINTQKIYKEKCTGKDFPVSEYFGARGLWLPSSSKLSNGDIDYIVEVIKSYYQNK